MTDNLPADNPAPKGEGDDTGRRDGGRFLAINTLHYHANELSELRKIAEIDPSGLIPTFGAHA